VFSDKSDKIADLGTTSVLPLENNGDSRVPPRNEGSVRMRLQVIDYAELALKLAPFGSVPAVSHFWFLGPAKEDFVHSFQDRWSDAEEEEAE
jgi:hypothetical protein